MLFDDLVFFDEEIRKSSFFTKLMRPGFQLVFECAILNFKLLEE
jgi:hypothetical protein